MGGRWLRLWFGLRDGVSRSDYLVSGLCLAAVKYLVELAVIQAVTGTWLTPLDMINPSLTARQRLLEDAPAWLGWALFAWNLPFIWIALSMSMRRAVVAGLSPWLGLGAILPGIGPIVMIGLAVAGDRAPGGWQPADPQRAATADSLRHRAALEAIGGALAVGIAMLMICVYLLESYGAALFLATPLVMGATAGFLFNRSVLRSLGATVGLATCMMLASAAVLLLFAFEGLICIAMAAPIVAPLGILGALLGKAVAELGGPRTAPLLPLLAALPLVAGAERLALRSPPLDCVRTVVEIDAPPEAVWPHVVSFPDLPAPQEWFFRCGIACPLRARIEGLGVGAVRHCEFTTGDFVEPITVWDPPRRLAFDVREQPDPMMELSPWRHVRPPHLHDRSLTSHRGEFLLVPLADGRTRLEGRTWYTFDMHPHGYWTLWSDWAIHAIHRRVLDHVKRLAEAD